MRLRLWLAVAAIIIALGFAISLIDSSGVEDETGQGEEAIEGAVEPAAEGAEAEEEVGEEGDAEIGELPPESFEATEEAFEVEDQ